MTEKEKQTKAGLNNALTAHYENDWAGTFWAINKVITLLESDHIVTDNKKVEPDEKPVAELIELIRTGLLDPKTWLQSNVALNCPALSQIYTLCDRLAELKDREEQILAKASAATKRAERAEAKLEEDAKKWEDIPSNSLLANTKVMFDNVPFTPFIVARELFIRAEQAEAENEFLNESSSNLAIELDEWRTRAEVLGAKLQDEIQKKNQYYDQTCMIEAQLKKAEAKLEAADNNISPYKTTILELSNDLDYCRAENSELRKTQRQPDPYA